MLPASFRDFKLRYVLFRPDCREAAPVRREGCPHCGGRLDAAPCRRKRRGIPQWILDEVGDPGSVCCTGGRAVGEHRNGESGKR